MLIHVNPKSALKAGILGTAIMTIVMYGFPLIDLPQMDIMAALGSVFSLGISPYIPGFLVHFGIGIVLAFIYAVAFYCWLPGPNWLKGGLYSLLPWLFAITLLAPSLQLAAQIFGTAQSGPMANPCAPKATANPCAPKVSNPCAAKAPANPCAPQAANPCAAKPVNPCAPKAANPCAPGGPSQPGVPPQVLSLVVHLIYGVVVGALYRPRV